MRRFLSRWCWSCIAIGAGLLLLSTFALAQSGAHDGGAFGYSPGALISGLIGLVTLLIGVYTAGMKSRLETQDKDLRAMSAKHEQFRVEVARDYARTAELRLQLTRMEDDIRRVHERLDRLGVPVGGKRG